MKIIQKSIWRAILLEDLEKFKFIAKELEKLEGNLRISDIQINKYGWTSLHAACYFGSLDLVQYLVEDQCADPNIQNSNGWNSLIFAVIGAADKNSGVSQEEDYTSIVDYLIESTNVDINLRDNSGYDVLAYAKNICPRGSLQKVLMKVWERKQIQTDGGLQLV